MAISAHFPLFNRALLLPTWPSAAAAAAATSSSCSFALSATGNRAHRHHSLPFCSTSFSFSPSSDSLPPSTSPSSLSSSSSSLLWKKSGFPDKPIEFSAAFERRIDALGSFAFSNLEDPALVVLPSSSLSDERVSKGGVGLRSQNAASWTCPTVAVDIDEVLGSFLQALNTFVCHRYSLNHTLSQYHVYNFKEVWKCSCVEAAKRVHEFFESEHFQHGIHPIPGAYQSLLKIVQHCHLFVVTSRQNVIRVPTLDWIDKHYSGIFKGVHFGNHFALEGEVRSKSEICRSLGAGILIDDNPLYALDCAQKGIKVLLFDYNNSYPWSKIAGDGLDHPLITRVHNWHEVESTLQEHLNIDFR